MFSTGTEPQGPPGRGDIPGPSPAALTGEASPALATNRPNALGLLLAFKRRWALALSLGVLCAAGVAAAVWYSIPTVYSGRTLVEISATPPHLLNASPVDHQFDLY